MAVEITSASVDWAMTHGVIFELNRQALHPRGMHMTGVPETNEVVIRSYDDAHGPYYSDRDFTGAAALNEAFDDLLLWDRLSLYGFLTQPRDWDGGGS